MHIIESVKILAQVLRNQQSSQEQIDESVSNYYDKVNQTQNEDEVGESMKVLSELFSLYNLKNGSIASMVCGTLIENGYPAKHIIDDFIDFFKKGFEESLPFIEFCEKELQKESKNDEDEENEYDFIDSKKEEFGNQFLESINSLEGLDSYYQCGISIFSSGREEFEKGKSNLSAVSRYANYNSAFYWFSELFEVLFDEKIVVIDLNTKRGFKGRISGVVDNFQLQILLMGLPDLNDKIVVPERYLDVVKGFDVQQLDESISGKWNMYNWEYLKYGTKDNSSMNSDSNYWIWGEGTPNDISKFDDYRVILLDSPSYSRGLPVQRTFDNLKAGIEVDQELSKNQIEELMIEMKNII